MKKDEAIMGACRFCGQMHQTTGVTQEEADRIATQVCQCDGAKRERRLREIIRDARERAEMLFGDGGKLDGFVPIDSQGVVALINAVIELVACGELNTLTMEIDGCGAAKITGTKTGGVRITRSRKMQKSEETV